MTLEQRVEYLLRAAARAERDGDLEIARSLRRMAEDILPLDRSRIKSIFTNAGP